MTLNWLMSDTLLEQRFSNKYAMRDWHVSSTVESLVLVLAFLNIPSLLAIGRSDVCTTAPAFNSRKSEDKS